MGRHKNARNLTNIFLTHTRPRAREGGNSAKEAHKSLSIPGATRIPDIVVDDARQALRAPKWPQPSQASVLARKLIGWQSQVRHNRCLNQGQVFAKIKMSNETSTTTTLQGLPRNPKREAIDTMAGYDYQIWTSIEAWMMLGDDELIFLEGAEDIDQVGESDATSTQVRRTASKISLNTKYAREAIKNYWSTQEREGNGRHIQYRYVTTSEIALEQNADFAGSTGIEMWHHARHDGTAAEVMRRYLIGSLEATGTLLNFLETASTATLQEQLFRRFHWVTHMPTIDVVRESVLDRLEQRVADPRVSRFELSKVRDVLFAYCWERVKKGATDRVLSRAALDREIEKATTVHVALPLGAVSTMLSAALQLPALQQHVASIALLNAGIPEVPYPLLARPDLAATLTTALQRRQPTLLTGSVFKGKTTIAAVVATAFCAKAWWINLSDRSAAQVKDICTLLTQLIESPDAPTLIVLDDLSLNASHKRAYKDALRKLIHRAGTADKSLLLTAQGQSQDLSAEAQQDFNLRFIEVPPLQEKEIEAHCHALGCPTVADAQIWGALVAAQTGGHPRLVQVRLRELQEAGWPKLRANDLLGTSPAVQTARQLARSLFYESVLPAEAEYTYVAAEFTVRPTREMLLHLGDIVPGLSNAGDVIDKLSGKWLEVHASRRYRVTPILRAVVDENWTKARMQQAHVWLYDAILRCAELSPGDGASLIFHAFVARDGRRLAPAAMRLATMVDTDIKNEVYKQLSWLLALRPSTGPYIFPELPMASLMLRHLQFNVAVAEGSSDVKELMLGWRDEVDALDDPSMGSEVMFSMGLLVANVALPFAILVRCAASLQNTNSQIAEMAKETFLTAQSDAPKPGFPSNATVFQGYLALKANVIRSRADFRDVVAWLGTERDPHLIEQFDQIVEWPFVGTLGTFVHSAWVSDSRTEDVDWQEWIVTLREAWDVAVQRNARAFGREISKALSIIYGEYLSDWENASTVLTEAAVAFGDSPILAEQSANTHYVRGEYAAGLEVWDRLVGTFGESALTDPFAYRRAAICAAKLDDWPKAAKLFAAGADTLPAFSDIPTPCALLTDAAYACAHSGNWREASGYLSHAVLTLPPSASDEGDAQWQIVIQLMSATATLVMRRELGEFPTGSVMTQPGYASNPGLTKPELKPGQALRVQVLKAQVALNESYWPDASASLMHAAAGLTDGTYPSAQFFASRAMLQHQVVTGVDSNFILYMARFAASMVSASAQRGGAASPEQVRSSLEPIMHGFAIIGLLFADDRAGELVESWIAETGEGIISAEWLAQLKSGLLSPINAAGIDVRPLRTSAAQAGAALAVLISKNGTPRLMAEAQGYITRFLNQRSCLDPATGPYRLLVARKFATHWRESLSSPQLFIAPRLSLAPLSAAINALGKGEGSLGELLSAVGFATGVALDEISSALRE